MAAPTVADIMADGATEGEDREASHTRTGEVTGGYRPVL
ncbi:hypothetical protein NOCA1120141 [metagenome]|uniref:Uncharacterized protein n=1 Tax=metagenome TaxID=256318 RepID=A0A2P2C3T0_9ZZZZ